MTREHFGPERMYDAQASMSYTFRAILDAVDEEKFMRDGNVGETGDYPWFDDSEPPHQVLSRLVEWVATDILRRTVTRD